MKKPNSYFKLASYVFDWQGVSWDPKNEYISTASSDRICRVFTQTGKHLKSRMGRGVLPVPEDHALFGKQVKYFHDDTFKSYFRRLQFSPDGNLLIVPAGCVETDDCKKALNAAFVFTLDDLRELVLLNLDYFLYFLFVFVVP